MIRTALFTGICIVIFTVSGQGELLSISGDSLHTVIEAPLLHEEDSIAIRDTLEENPEKIRFIHPYKFFDPSLVLNPPRVYATTGSILGMYAIANVWFSKAWYANYPRSKFHLFNDAAEWQQMDKAGHIQAAYFMSRWGNNLYHWSGVKDKHTPWIGALWGNAWQLAIEMQDGFSDEWGFSLSDIAANLSGSLLFLAQQYAWGDQRFMLKISAWPEKYPDDQKERAKQLYGTSFGEQLLKDYNANTFWLSASPGAFIKKPTSKFPKWIAVSFGYGAKGMLGGFDNIWCPDGASCPPTEMTDRSDIERIRQYYLSFDIDFTRIPTRSNALKTFFQIINIVKIPFPAVEFNSGGQVKWHWLMF
jgi:hypothetical protein